MKKYILCAAVFLFAVSLLAIPPAGAAPIFFTAVNNQLLDLTADTMPVVYGNDNYYVPYTVFDDSRLSTPNKLGISVSYSYVNGKQTVTLYTPRKTLYFDVYGGGSYDKPEGQNDRHSYPNSTIFHNGTVYVPLKFVCEHFGFQYSYLGAGEYGVIIRIKNENAQFSDDKFAEAAALQLESRYLQYQNSLKPSPPSAAPPSPTPTGTARDLRVYLCFLGASPEGTGAVLDILDTYGFRGTFFLSPDEIRENADLVRRMAGSGHSVGIVSTDDTQSDYREASELLLEAAWLKTVLILPPAGARESEYPGLLFCGFSINAVNSAPTANSVVKQLDNAANTASIALGATEATANILPSVLNQLARKGFDVRVMSETDYTKPA